MNELRERLKKQASDFAWLPENDGRKAAAFEDKLIELIVNECVDYAFYHGDDIEYVKHHFGVEK